MKQIKTIKRNTRRGSVLLISILMSTVVLSIGFGVYSRTYKELLFASFWKQTQIAFAAADAGLECAVYRDLNPASGSCFGVNFAWTPVNPGVWSPADISVAGGCVKIEVTKYNPALADGTTTQIKARGYNDACGSTSSRRVERGLGAAY